MKIKNRIIFCFRGTILSQEREQEYITLLEDIEFEQKQKEDELKVFHNYINKYRTKRDSMLQKENAPLHRLIYKINFSRQFALVVAAHVPLGKLMESFNVSSKVPYPRDLEYYTRKLK